MPSLRLLKFVSAGVLLAEGTKLSSYGSGAKFDKCIKISDWESKTLHDDIDLADRDANGCCPDDTVPGVKHYANYVGAQVICGFKSDGSIAMSTSSSNGVKTCTYNTCYVVKVDLTCADDSKLRLNGCCAAPASCSGNACGFKDTCKNYEKSMSNVFGDSTEYCLTYHTNYQLEGTSGTGDDQANDKLLLNKLRLYTPCQPIFDPLAGLTPTKAKLADYAQGEKFDKCIKISDWESKTLADELDLYDRDASGCCPDNTVPGVKHTTNYVGAQVECGFKSDGSIALSTSSSNGATSCTYNHCFVIKLDYTCADDSKLKLNGCCAAPGSCGGNSCGFKDTCNNYESSFTNVFGDRAEYCTTYHQTYSMEGTSEATDDVSSGDTPSLDVTNLYVYTPCEALKLGGDGTASSARSQRVLSAVVTSAAALSGWSLLAA